MKLIFKVTAVILIATTMQTLSAREIWNTDVGRIEYFTEIGPTAIWSYGSPENPGLIYILGLGGVDRNRGSYAGYWVLNKSKYTCETARMGLFGQMSNHWGRFEVEFIDKSNPSRWEATWSYCNNENQPDKIRAESIFSDLI